MADLFEVYEDTIDGPAWNAATVTPNDSTDLGTATRAIYVGGAGDVKVDMVGVGAAVTFVGVAAGSTLPIRVSRVYSTDTTATSIVGLW